MKKKYVSPHNLVKQEQSLWPDRHEIMFLAGEGLKLLLFMAGISAAVITLWGYYV